MPRDPGRKDKDFRQPGTRPSDNKQAPLTRTHERTIRRPSAKSKAQRRKPK